MARDLRRLTIADYDALINLWGDAGLPYRPLGRDTSEKIAREMARPETAFFGIFEDGTMTSSGLATYDGRKGWINRVAVHPDCRRRGLGAEIIVACEQFLDDIGAEIIAVLIEDDNLPSMDLFQQHGYLFGEGIHYFSKRKSSET